MSLHTSHPRTRSDRGPTVAPVSLVSALGFPLLLVALLAAASYPLASLVALSVLAVSAKLVQFALATLVCRIATSPRQLTIPGVGTVTISVAPI